MKKYLKLLSLCLVSVLLLAGCTMKAEYGIVVDKKQNVKLQFIVAQDDEMIDAMMDMGDLSDSDEKDDSKTHTDEERWKYLENQDNEDNDFADFEKAKYDKDGFKGYTYTMDLGNIDNLVKDSKEKIDIDSIDKDSKLFTKDGDVYKLNIQLSNEETSQMEEYASQVMFDVKLKVTLPNKAKTNNATIVEGNTYIWDLTKVSSIDLSFDFNESSSNNNILIIAIAAVIIIAIAYIIISSKKKHN